MSKREIIDCIIEINRTARPEFLAQFSAEDLDKYLDNLLEVDVEEYAAAPENKALRPDEKKAIGQ